MAQKARKQTRYSDGELGYSDGELGLIGHLSIAIKRSIEKKQRPQSQSLHRTH